MEDKMVNLDAVTDEAITMCQEAVKKLTDILNDKDLSYGNKVRAIVTAGRMLEKLDYVSEFASYRLYGIDNPTTEIRDRIQFIVNNNLVKSSFKHMVL